MLSGALIPCGGLSAHLRAASSATCSDLVAHQSQMLGDPSYGAQAVADREAYEQRLAKCDLSLGRPQATLDLSRGWPETVSRYEVTARAEAAPGHGDAARQALEKLARESSLPWAFFVDTTEVWPYSAQDRYVSLAMRAWSRSRGPSLDDYVSALVRHAGERLVTLDLASAEPNQPTGQWALWTGVTEGARVDRDTDQTVLWADGLDVHDRSTSATSWSPSARLDSRSLGTATIPPPSTRPS